MYVRIPPRECNAAACPLSHTAMTSWCRPTTADEALKQIEDKGYAKPFAVDPRKLFKIGVSFSTKTRRIEEWKLA